MALYPKPVEGSWTEHYPQRRDGHGLLRGLHLARVLRGRAGGGLQAGLAQRRPRRGRAPQRQLLHQGARGGEDLDHRGARPARARCERSTTSAGTVATSWCGTTSRGRRRAASCRAFTCKYHGWRYGLDGACTFVQQESEFFDLDKADYGLVPVHCDVWAGFIFVNLAEEPAQSLREFLGPMITAARGLPVRPDDRALRLPRRRRLQLEGLRRRLPGVLPRADPPPAGGHPGDAREDPQTGFEAPHYQLDGPHRMVSTSGVPRRLWPADYQYPIEIATRSGLFGPWDEPDLGDDLPGIEPGRDRPVGHRQLPDLPQPGDPDLGDRLVPRCTATGRPRTTRTGSRARSSSRRRRPPATAWPASARSSCSRSSRCRTPGTLVGTQQALESRAVGDDFPLCDQEILVRHLHKSVGDWVEDYRATRAEV